jgi:hypothetical protein
MSTAFTNSFSMVAVTSDSNLNIYMAAGNNNAIFLKVGPAPFPLITLKYGL